MGPIGLSATGVVTEHERGKWVAEAGSLIDQAERLADQVRTLHGQALGKKADKRATTEDITELTAFIARLESDHAGILG